MLKLFKPFEYYETGDLTVVANGKVQIVLGTPPTRLKEGKDGFNHPDLAFGALANFLGWPPQKIIELSESETYTIEPFTAYQITGDFTTEGVQYGKHKFSLQ